MKFNRAIVTVLLAVTLFVGSVLSSSADMSSCMNDCLRELSHNNMCEASCGHRASLPDLEVFVDGQLIQPTVAMKDDDYEIKNLKFDKKFYNTPAAFSDILEFKGSLMNAFYEEAAAKFVVPGREYNDETTLHLLRVPIPLTDSQFKNNQFMTKLLDIVPTGNKQYQPASELQFSEAYKEFLLSVNVENKGASSKEDKEKIEKQEAQLDAILDRYIELAQKCFEAYEKYIEKNQLSPISYTLEEYTPQNTFCKSAEERMKEHSEKTKELADFIDNLNPYDLLFKSIAKVAQVVEPSWDYSMADIEKFTEMHREMEEKEVKSTRNSYSIPVTIKREIFNHKYFGGNSATYNEKKIDAHLVFSGLGWKETPIAPSSTWFDMFALQQYKNAALNNKKDFFGRAGLLQRIPTYMLIAYKPVLKVKISQEMKEGFSKTASSQQLRPIESGPFVFTKVELRQNNGGKVKEEYEMILSCNLKQPQIIAFKSTPVRHVPKPPAPPQPEYIKFVDTVVSLKSQEQETYMSVSKEGDDAKIVSSGGRGPEERWIVRRSSDNHVLLTSTWSTYLSCEGNSAKTSKTKDNNSRFALIQVEGSRNSWMLRAANGAYLRLDEKKEGSPFRCTQRQKVASVFSIATHDTTFFQLLNKKVTIAGASGKFLRANGEGKDVTMSSKAGSSETWRVVNLGGEKVGFLSDDGRYLDAPEDTSYTTKKKFLFFSCCSKTVVVPAKVRTTSGINDCKKFTLKQDGNKIGLKPTCRNDYIKVLNDNELGLDNEMGGNSKFNIDIVDA